MPPQVELRIDDPRWEGVQRQADEALRALCAELAIEDDIEVSLLATDDPAIAELNSAFRGKAAATNVLSWPSEERTAPEEGGMPALQFLDPEIGDVALAYETCVREARAQAKPFDAHVTHLLVHGILHLMGFDHETDADAQLMEGIEVRALARLGVADPYKETRDHSPLNVDER